MTAQTELYKCHTEAAFKQMGKAAGTNIPHQSQGSYVQLMDLLPLASNLYLFSFLLTVKHKGEEGGLQMVSWSTAKVCMLAVKLAAVCVQSCLMINLSLCGRITETVLAKALARFKYAGSLGTYY